MLRINASQAHVDFTTTSLKAGDLELKAGDLDIQTRDAGYGSKRATATLPLRAVVIGTDVPPSRYPEPPVIVHANVSDLREFCESVLSQLQTAGY